MSETEGLLADAKVEGDDNQQQAEEQSISHLQPDTEPSLDDVTLASEDEEIAFEKPEWFPDKFWNEYEGPYLENLVKSYNELQKKFSQGQHKVPDEYDQSVFTQAGIPEDDELYATYRDWAKENGISQAAFNQLAGKFIELAGAEGRWQAPPKTAGQGPTQGSRQGRQDSAEHGCRRRLRLAIIAASAAAP